MKFIFLLLVTFTSSVFASQKPAEYAGKSFFYSPPQNANSQISQENKPQYTIKHKGFIETSLGGNSNKTSDGINFTSNQNSNANGRINARSIVEISDSGEQFKGVLDLTLGSNSYDDTASIASINQGYVEIKNMQSQPIQAQIRLGLQQSTATNLTVNSSTPMKNDQGVNGNWFRFVSLPTVSSSGYNPIFILQSKPLTSQGFASSQFLSDGSNYAQPSPYWSYANAGINFTTNRYSGFKLGFSYQPTTNNFANPTVDKRGNSFTNQQQMFMKDITSVAINYLNEWNGISLNTSISGEFASIEKSTSATFTRNNLQQYSVGANISYIGFTLAGSYSNSGKSLVIQNDSSQPNIADSYTSDLGISYAISSYQFGISHIQTSFMNNKMNTTVVSLSEDLSNSGRIKLTTLYELGYYDFASASYQNSGTTTAINPLHGMFLSIGLRTSF